MVYITPFIRKFGDTDWDTLISGTSVFHWPINDRTQCEVDDSDGWVNITFTDHAGDKSFVEECVTDFEYKVVIWEEAVNKPIKEWFIPECVTEDIIKPIGEEIVAMFNYYRTLSSIDSLS